MKLTIDEIKQFFADAGIKIISPEEAKNNPKAFKLSVEEIFEEMFGCEYYLFQKDDMTFMSCEKDDRAFICNENILVAA